MRELKDWSERDLFFLIENQVQEGLELDYKQSGSLARTSKAMGELAKDVSAFANSAGGRLIYGVVESGNIPVSIDSGSDPGVISREWIEQVINSRITPRVVGIVIKAIPVNGGGNAFVIDIPQANTFAPHQADNNKYYRRYNFESVPMADYEVKDAMRRSTTGSPYIRFQWQPTNPATDGIQCARLIVHGGNEASEPILYALIHIFIDARLIPVEYNHFQGWTVRRDAYIASKGVPAPVVILSRNVIPSQHMPFFKESDFTLADITVPVPPADSYLFGYKFAAPGVHKSLFGLFHIDGQKFNTDVDTPDELAWDGLPTM